MMWLATGVVLLTTACGSPTEPDDPRVPPPVGTPTRLQVQSCEYIGQTARCPVDAIWGDLYRSTRTVTTTATWSSDSPGVLRIVNGFALQAVAPGAAIVTVEYQGRRETIPFRVLASGPPWRVSPHSEWILKVVDTNGTALEGATVTVIEGAMAGVTSTTDRNGFTHAQIDFICGPATVRVTRPGFHDWIGSATECGRGGNGNWGSETIGPIRMTPL